MTNNSTNDSQLIRTFFECDEELINFFKGRLNCFETAKDLRQEVFVKLNRVESPDKIKNPRSFVFKIARNLLIDHFRSESYRRTILSEASNVPWDGQEPPSPEQATIARDAITKIRGSLPTLPPLTRKILYAHRFEKKTRKEIADQFGVSLTTIENHIARAMKHFEQALKDKTNDTS